MAKKHVRGILLTFLIFIILWLIWGNITVGTTHYEVASNRLPKSFNHYKIVAVSDVHNAEFGKNNSRLVSEIKKEKPDIIAITGDLVDSSKTNIETARKLVHKLAEIAPCYYVTGNHEAWLKSQYQELNKLLLDESVVILHDSTVQLEKDNASIQLAGLDAPDFADIDAAIQTSMLETKLNNMALNDSFCVLLSHRPEAFDAYVSENIDLVLSGHAHGGQFRLPFIGGIIAPDQGLFPKYDAGMYIENNTTMIVSRGIGNSIVPIRINNRPEIISVELICEE